MGLIDTKVNGITALFSIQHMGKVQKFSENSQPSSFGFSQTIRKCASESNVKDQEYNKTCFAKRHKYAREYTDMRAGMHGNSLSKYRKYYSSYFRSVG